MFAITRISSLSCPSDESRFQRCLGFRGLRPGAALRLPQAGMADAVGVIEGKTEIRKVEIWKLGVNVSWIF